MWDDGWEIRFLGGLVGRGLRHEGLWRGRERKGGVMEVVSTYVAAVTVVKG